MKALNGFVDIGFEMIGGAWNEVRDTCTACNLQMRFHSCDSNPLLAVHTA